MFILGTDLVKSVDVDVYTLTHTHTRGCVALRYHRIISCQRQLGVGQMVCENQDDIEFVLILRMHLRSISRHSWIVRNDLQHRRARANASVIWPVCRINTKTVRWCQYEVRILLHVCTCRYGGRVENFQTASFNHVISVQSEYHLHRQRHVS